LEAAELGHWVLVCPIVFPQFLAKLNDKFEELKEAGQMNSNFRLIVDLQNLNQNEVPDSFLTSQAYIFHLAAQNYDTIMTFNDIWTHILNPKYLNLLTSLEEDAVSRLAKLDSEVTGLGNERFV
jgi:hypothetical protein